MKEHQFVEFDNILNLKRVPSSLPETQNYWTIFLINLMKSKLIHREAIRLDNQFLKNFH